MTYGTTVWSVITCFRFWLITHELLGVFKLFLHSVFCGWYQIDWYETSMKIFFKSFSTNVNSSWLLMSILSCEHTVMSNECICMYFLLFYSMMNRPTLSADMWNFNQYKNCLLFCVVVQTSCHHPFASAALRLRIRPLSTLCVTHGEYILQVLPVCLFLCYLLEIDEKVDISSKDIFHV